jgi:hypothetical protein
MWRWPTLEFLEENAASPRYFAFERASDFQKSPFLPAQVGARKTCARKNKTDVEVRRAKPRKNQGFRAHISASLHLKDFHILTAHSFRPRFPEQIDLASRALLGQMLADGRSCEW